MRIQTVPETKRETDRYGLVLGGGGAKGCYHVGVWQAMNEEGITFDALTGTSIGALVGIFYPGNNIEPVTDFVMNMEPENIAQDLPVLPVTLKQKVQGTRTILQFVIRYFDSKMDITPLRTHFQDMFDYDSFAASPVKFACMTYNDTKKEAKPFFKGEITRENAETIVMASSACYPAFPKVQYEGNEYMDGMYADNVPIELLSRIQPDTDWTVVVDLHDPGDSAPPALKESMFYIQPLLQPGNPLDFSRPHAEKLYAQGYLETKKYLGKYPGYLYTFTENDQPLIQIVEEYLGRQITQMHIVLPRQETLVSDVFRTVLGYLPPELPGFQEPYEFGKIVEALALTARIEPIALYDYRQFLSMVLESLNSMNALHTSPEEFRLISLLGNVKREEIPNVLYRLLKLNGGKFPEKVESIKEWIPVSYTLAVIRYCLELLLEQLEPAGTDDSDGTAPAAKTMNPEMSDSSSGVLDHAAQKMDDHSLAVPLPSGQPLQSSERAQDLLEQGVQSSVISEKTDPEFLPALPVKNES